MGKRCCVGGITIHLKGLKIMASADAMDEDKKVEEKAVEGEGKKEFESDSVKEKVKESENVKKVESLLAKNGANKGKSFDSGCLEELLGIEKASRLSGDTQGVKAACDAIMDISKASGKWELVNENILTLSKRRAQLKQAIAGIVNKAMGWIEEANEVEGEKEKLIRTLLAVTAGKIFVEVERARLTRMLASMKEKEGK